MNIKLYSPHEKQKEIHEAINNTDSFYYILNIGRQFGKTALLENQCLYWAINEKDIVIGWVSPTHSQAKKSFRSILNAIRGCVVLQSKNESELRILFANGSIIEFYSAAQEDGIRGKTFHYLVCDEFAFFKKETWEEILEATILIKGKKCVLSSTPKGKNMFFDMYNEGKGKDPYYLSFKGTSYQNPFANKDKLKRIKDRVPEAVWEQEYLAEFVDSASVFKNVEKCINERPATTSSYYIGIDIGFQDDSTVVTVLNDNNQMVEQTAINNCTTKEVKDLIVSTINKYPHCKAYLELNNQGIAIYHDVVDEHRLHGTLEGFTTTVKTKGLIINNLVKCFNEESISILDSQELQDELAAYIYKVSTTGVLKFEAASGFHDDRVMSLAIATYCYFENKISNNFNYVIG